MPISAISELSRLTVQHSYQARLTWRTTRSELPQSKTSTSTSVNTSTMSAAQQRTGMNIEVVTATSGHSMGE